MKCTLETLTGTKIHREIDTSDTPMAIVRKFYEDDPTAAEQIFTNHRALEQMMDGNIEENKSTFDLIGADGDNIRASWKEPLCNQAALKEELSKLESEGQVPTFVVSVTSIVAGTAR